MFLAAHLRSFPIQINEALTVKYQIAKLFLLLGNT